MPTYTPKASEIERAWHVVDAEGLVLGRLATEVARILRGKHKPIFAPHIDTGDHVIVDQRRQGRAHRPARPRRRWCTATPATRAASGPAPTPSCSPRKPEEAVRRTIRGMLPKNRLGRQMLTKLKVYAGPTHPHAAQQPAAARPRPRPRAAARRRRPIRCPSPLVQTTGRRKRAVARVRFRARATARSPSTGVTSRTTSPTTPTA